MVVIVSLPERREEGCCLVDVPRRAPSLPLARSLVAFSLSESVVSSARLAGGVVCVSGTGDGAARVCA